MTGNPKTLVDLMAEFESFETDAEIAWYRGHGDPSYSLRPKIARKGPGAYTFTETHSIEAALSNEFLVRSRPYIRAVSDDNLDNMFNMQHYGVPTRLLDWSSSPFVAAFFALLSTSGHDRDAVIWMCRPAKWNKAYLTPAANQYPILDKSDPRSRKTLDDYAYGLEVHEYRPEPLMIVGSHNNERVRAQSGGFTIFGNDFTPLDEIASKKDELKSGVLEKITIEKADREKIFESLVRKGITETFVYPDIVGLASEMTRKYRIK